MLRAILPHTPAIPPKSAKYRIIPPKTPIQDYVASYKLQRYGQQFLEVILGQDAG
jgi:hypothetical protein